MLYKFNVDEYHLVLDSGSVCMFQASSQISPDSFRELQAAWSIIITITV